MKKLTKSLTPLPAIRELYVNILHNLKNLAKNVHRTHEKNYKTWFQV